MDLGTPTFEMEDRVDQSNVLDQVCIISHQLADLEFPLDPRLPKATASICDPSTKDSKNVTMHRSSAAG